MLFIRLCFDAPDTLALREEHRMTHRAYLQSGVVELIQAGPLLNDDGSGDNIASFMIFKADDLAAAKSFHDNDPFTKAGVFAKSHVHKWDRHI